MPWFIDLDHSSRQHIVHHWPQALGAMGRFYAMGADAYQLANQLQQLKVLSNANLSGLTGTLSKGPGQRIERTLYWTQFVDGKLKQLKEPQFE